MSAVAGGPERGVDHSFWCVRDELVLGAYSDGRWTISRAALGEATEQIVVSLHERLHHELQHTTPWGVMTEMLSLVGKRNPSRKRSFVRLARFGKNTSRITHEVYATTHSVAARDTHAAWLDASRSHRPFYEVGLRLSLGDLDSSRFLFDALVRCAMSPAALLHALEHGLDGLSLRSLDHPDLRPDDRLDRILASDLSLLTGLHPTGRSVEELTEYHDVVADIVRAGGLPILTSTEIRHLLLAIIGSVGEIDPSLVDLIEFDSERDPTSDDVEAAQHERVVLRADRLPLVRPEATEVAATDLMLFDDVLGPHVLLLWAARRVFEAQFDVGHLDAGDYPVAIVAPLIEDGSVRAVRALVADGADGPDALAEHLGSVRSVVMTTSTSLMAAPASARSEHVPILYALVDGPILHQLEHTFGSRGRLTWDSYDMRRGSELSITVFSIDVLPGIRWIHLATIAARSYLVTWLESREGTDARRAKGAFDDERPAVDTVVGFVRATWSVVAQDG